MNGNESSKRIQSNRIDERAVLSSQVAVELTGIFENGHLLAQLVPDVHSYHFFILPVRESALCIGLVAKIRLPVAVVNRVEGRRREDCKVSARLGSVYHCFVYFLHFTVPLQDARYSSRSGVTPQVFTVKKNFPKLVCQSK